MEIQYYGGNCVRLSTKKASVIIDDTLDELGGKSVSKSGDIALFTTVTPKPPKDAKITIDLPGEYEVSDISIQGIPARAHIDADAKGQTATMFKIIADDIRIGVLGHIYPELNDQQLEALGTVDVLIVPVGGNGYTLDAVGALKLIKKIEPRMIIPTHYAGKGLKYPVPQVELADALKELAMEPKETVAKLKIKPADLTETSQLVILERQ